MGKLINNEDLLAPYEEAMQAIKDLKEKFGGISLFGNDKDILSED
ncbi:hypothetical protein [Pedobacter glucosidilyticus]|nr:hypothetical protein [Pedobacter glucosidilyticus]